ncbi:MAG: AAA family ATPase [Actinomycetota bacterium]|nr:AAA family ATPase [Actinomycetota bacterium]
MDNEPALVRPYRHGDLGRVVSLWEDEGIVPIGPDGLTVDEATDLMASEDAEVLVAERDGDILGVALGAVSGVVGTIFRVVGPADLSARLLNNLEDHLAERGVRKLVTTASDSAPLGQRLVDMGYQRIQDRVIFERGVPSTTAGPTAVSEVGGQLIEPGLWDRLKGMEQAKRLIERRVILPLSEADLASRHGVASPRAVVLFGPPGTGKTTFAKGIASRLEWPFVEVEAFELAQEGAEEETQVLGRVFDRVLELPSAVVFLDEVEAIASSRDQERRFSYRVTTEFLKQVPKLRDAPHHLLVCATNWVGRLDEAFLRPGRFDYLLPVGPPDEEARAAIWQRYIGEITDRDVDIDALVDASERYTPADIEFAARKAAQLAFEQQYFEDSSGRATTEHFLSAIEETRPSLTQEMVDIFEHDVERFARY